MIKEKLKTETQFMPHAEQSIETLEKKPWTPPEIRRIILPDLSFQAGIGHDGDAASGHS